MAITGISGAIGTGKTHMLVASAIEHADRKRKGLVFNFDVNFRNLYKYAQYKKFRWVQYLLMTGGVSVINSPSILEALFLPNSVVCLDEAGIWLNSRNFSSTSKNLLAELALARHHGVDLFWSSQFLEQVDKQLRLLTQFWIHCDGIAFYSRKHRGPRLVWKRYYYLKAWDYQAWLVNPADRTSHWKLRFAYAFRYIGGRLNKEDKLLFRVFDSFNKMMKEERDYVQTNQKVMLPSTYYDVNKSLRTDEEIKGRVKSIIDDIVPFGKGEDCANLQVINGVLC